VPDNDDYAALGRLLASPETWTTEDATVARSLLRDQEDAVKGRASEGIRRRDDMQAVADDLRAAIAIWERSSG
jgi:hypothetical protein